MSECRYNALFQVETALEVIGAQKAAPSTMCVYVALNKTPEEVQAIHAELRARGADRYTTVVASFDFEGPIEQLLAANVAVSVGESIRHAGGDVLMVYDDLGSHVEVLSETWRLNSCGTISA